MITLAKLKHLIVLERIAVALMAGTVTLAWDANTEPDLAGYNIHYGQASGDYAHSIDVGDVTEYTVQDLVPGKRYFFAATAYDEDNNTSAYSDELNIIIENGTDPKETPMNPPKGIRK